ncbi:cell filamentation protein Fic [Romboutsia maritimum]|uniref:Cell filamentation protein Fic n=1 Tax=Romboutsia maritimum TaxID=2020948 RepID=A0A371IPY6_9FIRM|nr:Fic family protein [Romboutsia maritimum]RDY22541.1 cell filamentation protein Fic [Romboutsia maritimum]
MSFLIENKVENIAVNMNIVKSLSKINEYKGRQILYKKQPKEILEKLSKVALLECIQDTPRESISDEYEIGLDRIISNKEIPKNRNEICVVEYRDVLKTINSGYEDIEVTSKMILELHGYLHKFSRNIGGKYRAANEISEEFYFSNKQIRIKTPRILNVQKSIEELCKVYNESIVSDKADILILIAVFILDFITIRPFEYGNVKMAKLLMILLLNKNGYEVGKYINLGKFFEKKSENSFKNLFNENSYVDLKICDINIWLNYFLRDILESYEKLDYKLNIVEIKKETKTSKIEKVINATLGYFTKDDIRRMCPDIPTPTINRVFNNLRKQNKIEVIAKGRSAKWKKKY